MPKQSITHTEKNCNNCTKRNRTPRVTSERKQKARMWNILWAWYVNGFWVTAVCEWERNSAILYISFSEVNERRRKKRVLLQFFFRCFRSPLYWIERIYVIRGFLFAWRIGKQHWSNGMSARTHSPMILSAFCYHCRCVCPRVVRISANKNRSQNRMREKKMRMLLLPSKSLLNALCIMWWRRLKSLRMLFLNVTVCVCVCEWVCFFLLIWASFATQPFHLTGHNYMYILCNTLSFCSASFEQLST